jgi:hypothetical protein
MISQRCPEVMRGVGQALGGIAATGVLLGGVVGCAPGPVLADSSDELTADTRAVLAETAARLGPPGARGEILQDTTRACRDGRAQRVYRAAFPLQPQATASVVLERATNLSLAIITARGYRLDGPPSHHVFTLTRESPAVDLTVRLYPGPTPVFELDAVTPCLARE